ncbi:MAG: conserved hypothetical protein, membrane [Candidatus Syntrophoarchaeum caldarius]|uniref:Uncharacterized protein n=1 Tax=Candidatus Syntropharchaeum caldarium TaxID=1838285 RepID=A0A1F2PBD8_9EURY|nr:MAG: conserved hypothetical protein, membrane [Candidatus Syntrophoarchaeum caldarius]
MIEDAEVDKHREYVEGIIKTAVPLFAGALAGTISYLLDPSNPKNNLGWVVLFGAILLQVFIYPRFSIDVKSFRIKEWFYLIFMTFITWFVFWGILLMTFTP